MPDVRYVAGLNSASVRTSIAARLLSMAMPAAAADSGIPVQVLNSTTACRGSSDAIRLALRMAEGDKPGWMTAYVAKQVSGACVPLRAGTRALLQDGHDEQGLRVVCLKQTEHAACFWSVGPRFEAP